jgi:hypothetical protein
MVIGNVVAGAMRAKAVGVIDRVSNLPSDSERQDRFEVPAGSHESALVSLIKVIDD